MKWEWCIIEKLKGGLGLKDLRLQGISLVMKLVIGALEGGEPWKVLIRQISSVLSPNMQNHGNIFHLVIFLVVNGLCHL